MKEALALIVGRDEDDVRLYELLTADRRLSLALQQQQDKLKAASKQKGSTNPYAAAAAAPPPSSGASQSKDAALADYVQPPLDCDRKVSECGLDNDAIVLFCYRLGEQDEWEELEAVGVMERKGNSSSRRSEEKDEHER